MPPDRTYTVSQAADAAGVLTETLKTWRKTGRLVVGDDSGGWTRYSADDVLTVAFVAELARVNVPVADAHRLAIEFAAEIRSKEAVAFRTDRVTDLAFLDLDDVAGWVRRQRTRGVVVVDLASVRGYAAASIRPPGGFTGDLPEWDPMRRRLSVPKASGRTPDIEAEEEAEDAAAPTDTAEKHLAAWRGTSAAKKEG